MTYLTKATPKDTATTSLGRAFGKLKHEWYFWNMEYDCTAWCKFIPDVFPLTELEKIIVKLYQWSYDKNYQRAYDEGAKVGDDVYNKIFGDIDTAKKALTKLIDDVKAKLQGAIDDANTKLKDLKKVLESLDSEVDKALGDFNAKVNDALKKVNAVISDMDKLAKDAKAKFDAFDKSLKDLQNEVKTKLDAFNKSLTDYQNKAKADFDKHWKYITDLVERVKKLEEQMGLPPKPYEGKSLWDIIEEMLGIE